MNKKPLFKLSFFFLLFFVFSKSLYSLNCPPVVGDNTQNLKNCIDQAKNSDLIVFLSGGRYPISEQIIVSESVSIVGIGTLWGTVLDINFGQDQTSKDLAAFVLKNYASLDGITFNYPVQQKGYRLKMFPPTVSVQGSFCRVKNSFFPNSYIGIEASVPHGKLNLLNLEFGVYFRAIQIDQCYDIDKIDVIHANPGMFRTWKDDSDIFSWMMENSATLEVGRIDWLYVNQFFAFGTKYGILITESEHGTVGDAQIIQAGCDACRFGIYSDNKKHFPWLITISNFSGTAFDPATGGGSGMGIYLKNIKGVNITNSNFWGVRDDGIYIEKSSSVILSGNVFHNNSWNMSKGGFSAIHLVNCNRGTIIANSGSNNIKGSYGIRIEGGSSINILGNAFDVPIFIENGAKDIFVMGNTGCTYDETNDSSNRIDVYCRGIPYDGEIKIPKINPGSGKRPYQSKLNLAFFSSFISVLFILFYKF